MTVRLPTQRDQQARVLYEVIREVRRLFHRLATSTDRLHADLDVSAAQRAVLEALEDGGPASVPDLARRKGVSRQHIQVVANELRAVGLVEFRPNPAHRRSPLLGLTEAGRQTFGEMRSRETRLLEEVVTRFAARRLAQVGATLQELGDAVDELVGRR